MLTRRCTYHTTDSRVKKQAGGGNVPRSPAYTQSTCRTLVLTLTGRTSALPATLGTLQIYKLSLIRQWLGRKFLQNLSKIIVECQKWKFRKPSRPTEPRITNLYYLKSKNLWDACQKSVCAPAPPRRPDKIAITIITISFQSIFFICVIKLKTMQFRIFRIQWHSRIRLVPSPRVTDRLGCGLQPWSCRCGQ